MKSNLFLSVVIPAYNEEKNLKKGALVEVVNFLNKQPYLWEIIVVDDGSVDETIEFVKKLVKGQENITLIKNPHQGKAVTVITGMLQAKGQIILFTDMDQATPITQIDKLLPKFEDGFDIAIGSRRGRKGAPLTRKLMANSFSLLRGLFLGLPFFDTQCGFKAFRQEVAQNIFHRLKIYNQRKVIQGSAVTAGFDIETLFLARKLGYKVAEVPVDWNYQTTGRVNPIKDSIAGLKGLLKVRLNGWRGEYDK